MSSPSNFRNNVHQIKAKKKSAPEVTSQSPATAGGEGTDRTGRRGGLTAQSADGDQPDPREPRYEVTHYDGTEISTRIVTRAEMLAIDPGSVDHYQARCLGLLSFRTATGDRREYRGRWPKLGPAGLRVLHALQLNPGDFLCPSEIAALTGWRSLERNGALTALIMRLRKAHDEQGQAAWFIETSTAGGYFVRWPKHRTWMWVERVTPTTPIDR